LILNHFWSLLTITLSGKGEKIIKGYFRIPFEVAVARYIQEESSGSHTSGATNATEATEAIHIEPEELF